MRTVKQVGRRGLLHYGNGHRGRRHPGEPIGGDRPAVRLPPEDDDLPARRGGERPSVVQGMVNCYGAARPSVQKQILNLQDDEGNA